MFVCECVYFPGEYVFPRDLFTRAGTLEYSLRLLPFKLPRVFFIGPQFLFLTPQWIRQPEPRDVHDVCLSVCKCVHKRYSLHG
jgi:hypothetical protein